MRSTQEKIIIEILNWEEYAGTSRAPFYFRLPMTISNRWKDLSKHDKGVMVELLAAAGSDRSSPGVILGLPGDIAQALSMKTRGFLQAAQRLVECQLIQIDTNFHAGMYRRVKDTEKNKKEGHFLFPDWVFEKANLKFYEPTGENRFLSMEVFMRNIFEQYPKEDPEPLQRVYDHLSRVIYDERWVLFVQTCLRNHERRKRAESVSPKYLRMDRYFMEREWWMDFLNDQGQIPNSWITQVKVTATGEQVPVDSNIIHPIRPENQNNVEELDGRPEKPLNPGLKSSLDNLIETVSKTKNGL